ncbi:MAG: flippase [Desulfuromonadales bacterium]
MNVTWIKYLPAFVRRRLEGRHDLLKMIGNTGWLFFDKILRMGIGLFVGVWVARYLGPELFGKYSYVLAFVALFSAFSNLGLEGIVIREIVRKPDCIDETLGSAFALKLFGAVLTMLLSVIFVQATHPRDESINILVLIVASGAFFQVFDTIDFWFQSQVNSRFTVVARNSAFLIVSFIKIILIWMSAPLVAFAWAGLTETALGACGLVLAFRRTGLRLGSWKFCMTKARKLLAESWPLFLSMVFVTLYIKIDQVMVGQMLGDREVGIYSSAVSLVEVWYFIPMAIASSVFPAVINAKKKGENDYYAVFDKLYLIMVWLSLAVAVPVTLFAGPIVQMVFGPEYSGGAAVLSISCWSGLFISFGLVSNHWYLLENLNHYTLYRHVLGAGINVALNMLLIPRYGINGAAFATLVTQFVASYLFDVVNRPTRILFRIKTRYYFMFIPISMRLLFAPSASMGNHNLMKGDD